LDRQYKQRCISRPPIHLDAGRMYTIAYHVGFISSGVVGNRPIAPSTHSAMHDNTLQLHCRDHDDTAEYRLPADKTFCPRRRRHGWSGIGCRPIHTSSRILYLVLSCEHDEALISHIQWSLPLQEAFSFEHAARRPHSEIHRHN
jgi:hypothetical protein